MMSATTAVTAVGYTDETDLNWLCVQRNRPSTETMRLCLSVELSAA